MSSVKIFSSLEEANQRVPRGSLKRLVIGEKEFCLIHTDEGFKLTSNFCPHRNEYLHKGSVNSYNEIICPLHQYRFSLEDGQEANNRCGHLKVFPIKINKDGVFAHL